MFFKTRLTAILSIAAFASFSSCSKKGGDESPAASVTANFSYSGAGLAPATVTFTNSSSGATSYAWDFGDNSSSTQTSPSHTYTQAGVYTVKLTATGNGRTNSVNKTVNITAPTSVKVVSVKVTAMPFTNSTGGGWDNNSGPDVYYQFTDANDVNLLKSPTFFANVTPAQLPLPFTLNPAFQFTNLAAQVKLLIWDEDASDLPPSGDDFIGGYQFNFAAYAAAGYPSTVTLQTSSTSTLKLEMQLQWQ
jgi:PKD repeat protein